MVAARVLPIIPALLAPVAVGLSRALGGPVFLPILATLAVWPVMTFLVIRGRRLAAVLTVLGWAVSLSVSVIALTTAGPSEAGTLVLHGPAYRDEMFGFIRTGTGREADPGRFVLQHLAHLVLFAVLALPSAGLLGLGMGAALVAYMSFYVGALAAACPGSVLPIVAGWPPWAIARVAGFVLIGVVLAEPALAIVRRRPGAPVDPGPRFWIDAAGRRFASRALVVAGALLAADVALKAWLAPHWAGLLRGCLSAP
jgi:hypothetical protein